MSVISVVVPVYNEQDNILVLEKTLKIILGPIEPDYEIIFVDDGSTDNSLNIIRELAKTDRKVKYVSFNRNFGQQAAITAGLDFASGDAVITMDADFQDPPELLPEMLKAWETGNDVVLMRRKYRHEGFFKKISASLYYFFLKRLSEYKFPGNIGEFRLMSRSAVNELKNLREKTRYLRGLILWMGFTHIIIDYDRPNRKRGKTGFSLLKMFRLGMHGILSFSLLPLRLGMLVGFAAILLGMFFLVYIIVDILKNDVYYELVKWLSVVTFIFVGFIFILIWILGEYIGKIYNEVINRPIYLIREKGNFDS